MDIERAESDDSSTKRLIDAGAELAGTTGGALIGLGVAGPPGAVVGAGLGSIVGSMLKEFGARVLGRRQQVRVGAAALFAAVALREQIDAGRSLRTDGFFEDDETGLRSAAKEVAEGVFLAAQQEHEEKKVKYIGYLLANIAFQEEVDRSLANWLISRAEELTWTQFVLLAAIQRKDHFSIPDIKIGSNATSWQSWGIHSQLQDLGPGKRNLIGPRNEAKSSDTDRLRSQDLLNGGTLLYRNLSLDHIPIGEYLAVLSSIVAPPSGAQRQALIQQEQDLKKVYRGVDIESKKWLCSIHSWHDKVKATYVADPGVADSFRVKSLRCPDCEAVTLVN